MKTGIEGGPAPRILRALAWLQAALIAVLLVALFLRTGETAPAHAAPSEALEQTPTHAPAAAVHAPVNAPEGGPDTPLAAGPVARPASAPAVPAGTVLYGRVINDAGDAVTQGFLSFSFPGQSKTVARVSLRPEDSSFAIPGLPPGKLECSGRCAGFKDLRATIEIPAGVPRLRHDLVLTQSWLLAVKIQTPEGKPLHEALQEAAKARPMLFHVEACAVATAARPQGDFPFTALREVDFGVGRWRGSRGIGARMDGSKMPKDASGVLEIERRQPLWISAVLRHRVLASAQVQPGQEEVVLTVPLDQVLGDLGTIRGRVVDTATGAAVANATVGFGDLQSGGGGGKSDAEGRFEAKDLRPGLLAVEIRGDKRQARRDLVLLLPGQVLDLGDVPVFEFRQIKGRCEGLLSKAEESARISYTPLEPPWHAAVRRYNDSVSIAADGTFTLHLPDGRYLLRASGAGGVVTEIDTRALGEGPLVLKLAQEAPLRIDVQSSGEPWNLAVFDNSGREVYRRDLRDGWKFPLWFLPGAYRVELTDSRGRMQARQLRLGEGGVDLRVP